MTSYIFNLSAVFFKNFFINFYYSTVKGGVQTRQFSDAGKKAHLVKKSLSSLLNVTQKINPWFITGFTVYSSPFCLVQQANNLSSSKKKGYNFI